MCIKPPCASISPPASPPPPLQPPARPLSDGLPVTEAARSLSEHGNGHPQNVDDIPLLDSTSSGSKRKHEDDDDSDNSTVEEVGSSHKCPCCDKNEARVQRIEDIKLLVDIIEKLLLTNAEPIKLMIAIRYLLYAVNGRTNLPRVKALFKSILDRDINLEEITRSQLIEVQDVLFDEISKILRDMRREETEDMGDR